MKQVFNVCKKKGKGILIAIQRTMSDAIFVHPGTVKVVLCRGWMKDRNLLR